MTNSVIACIITVRYHKRTTAGKYSRIYSKWGESMFESGLQYVRADFHLHTCKDKEFVYSGEQNSFINDYVSALKEANINVGIITNHNSYLE